MLIITGLALAVFSFFTYRLRQLTFMGALLGWIIAFFLFLVFGWAGLLPMTFFFILGAGASAIANTSTKTRKIAETRNAAQVIANAGVPFLLACAAWFHKDQSSAYLLMLGGAFSSAAADTVSSELGTAFGTRFINIITWKKDQKGKDGVVSLQGSLFGLAASVLVSAVYCLCTNWNWNFAWIVLCGTLGNFADSYLGARWERRGKLSNNQVNFLNTLVGAVAAFLLNKIQ